MKPKTIRVIASQRDEFEATHANLIVAIESLPDDESNPDLKKSLDVSELFDLFASANLFLKVTHLESVDTKTPSSIHRFYIRCEQPAQFNTLISVISSLRNMTIEKVQWQYSNEPSLEKNFERAIDKANTSARKMATSLGMRLLGIHTLNKHIVEEDLPGTIQDAQTVIIHPSKMVEACVEIEYRVSGFHQIWVDFRIIQTSNNLRQLLKKELLTQWFKLRLRIISRFSRNHNIAKTPKSDRALVVGYFSIPGGGGTFGDIEAQEVVCEWLSEAQIEFDVASNMEDGIKGLKIEDVDESKYGIFIFVCGPWYPQKSIPTMLLKKFGHCVKIGINLTIFEAGKSGFDYLLSRDNLVEMRADISFAKKMNLLPVIGVVLVERQMNYGERQRHLYVKQVINEYLKMGQVVPIWLDTNANNNNTGLKTGQEFESLIRKVDIVITNRLHGMVLSLKNSVPVISIDAIAGGGKVTAQAKVLGWPVLISAEELTVEKLQESVNACLSRDLKPEIQRTQHQALSSLEHTKNELLNILHEIKPSQ